MQQSNDRALSQSYLVKSAQQALFGQLLQAIIAGLKEAQDVSALWHKLSVLTRFLRLSHSTLFIQACQYLQHNTQTSSEPSQERNKQVLLLRYVLFFYRLIQLYPDSFEQELGKRRNHSNLTLAPELLLPQLPDLQPRTCALNSLSHTDFVQGKRFIQTSLKHSHIPHLSHVQRALLNSMQDTNWQDMAQVCRQSNVLLFLAEMPYSYQQAQLTQLPPEALQRFIWLLKQALSPLSFGVKQHYANALSAILAQHAKAQANTAVTQCATLGRQTDDEFNLKQIFIFELESQLVSFQRFSKLQEVQQGIQQQADIMRAAHSIKGSANIAGLHSLGQLFAKVEHYLVAHSINSYAQLQQMQQLAGLCEQYLACFIATDSKPKQQYQHQQAILDWLHDKSLDNQQQTWHTQLKDWLCLTENDCLLDDPSAMSADKQAEYAQQVHRLFKHFKYRYYPEFEYFLVLYQQYLKAPATVEADIQAFSATLEYNLNQLMSGSAPEVSAQTLEQLEAVCQSNASADEQLFYRTCIELLNEVQHSVQQNPQVPLFAWLKKELKNLIQAANYLSLHTLSGFFFSLLRLMVESPRQSVSNMQQTQKLLDACQILLQRRQYYPHYATSQALQEVDALKRAITYQPRAKSEFAEEIENVFQQEAHTLLHGIKAQLDKWQANPQHQGFAHAILRLLHTLKGSAKLAEHKEVAKCAHEFEEQLLHDAPSDLSYINQQYKQLKQVLQPANSVKKNRKDQRLIPRFYKSELSLSSHTLEQQLALAGENIIMRDRIDRQMRSVSFVIEELDRTLERLLTQTQQLAQEAATPTPTVTESHALELESYSRLHSISQVINESVSDIKDIRHSIVRRNLLTQQFLNSQAKINMRLQQSLLQARQIEFAQILPRLYATCEKNSLELNKPARLRVKNKQLKIDQNLLEQLVVPLEHIIRNALDHGIEEQHQRRQHNKPEVASIFIEVSKTTSEYQLEIYDDGMGLDLHKIRQTALEKGLINAQQEINESDCLQLIFSPGFSTANEVTDISGRGFGLDIVDYEIKKMGGQIEVFSQQPQGAGFRIRLPFSVSQNKALFVQQDKQRFAIPLGHIKATLRLTDELNIQHNQLDYLGQQYPIRRLSQLLNLADNPAAQPALLLINSLVPTAVIVDKLLAFREIVIKSLGSSLSEFSPVVGGSVLADGQIVPVLDLPALILQQHSDKPTASVQTPVPMSAAQAPLILVVDDSVTVRKYTSRMLMAQGYRTMRARDGLEAVEKMHKQPPNLVLLDIEMPNMDGFEVAALMQHEQQLKDIPIIMISSRSGKTYRKKAKSMGVRHFLNKPYDQQELLTLIQTYHSH